MNTADNTQVPECHSRLKVVYNGNLNDPSTFRLRAALHLRPRPHPSANTSGTTSYGGQSALSAPRLQQRQHNLSSSLGGGLGGASTAPAATQQQREAQRFEQERQERAERERREAEERGIVEQLEEQQREEVDEAFPLFNLDKDGYIDYHEVKVALKALGFERSKSEARTLLQTRGTLASSLTQDPTYRGPQPHTGDRHSFTGPGRLLLNCAAFQYIAAAKIHARKPEEEILRAFKLFNAEGKRLINVGDLQRVANELAYNVPDEELYAMIDEFDIWEGGAIGCDEFMGICMG
ncbi:Calcium-binding component of the spindle pole body (SPB) half-bridge [Recurvomyces mirabilis]|nr:Calcium-binding component of the spindle pole body (SPB) half-bridge [Recurvomyces mirabilis]